MTAESAAPFKIEGVYCRLIPLTQGYFTIVDVADYDALADRKWSVWIGKRGHKYAVCVSSRGDGHRLTLMHRELLGLKRGDREQTDHRSGVGLDNRRANLRLATCQQNNRNTKRNRVNSTGFKGVQKYFNRYRAFITIDERRIWLGSFATPEVAHAAYCDAARQHFGEFARFA